jgi:hypothetical protein
VTVDLNDSFFEFGMQEVLVWVNEFRQVSLVAKVLAPEHAKKIFWHGKYERVFDGLMLSNK